MFADCLIFFRLSATCCVDTSSVNFTDRLVLGFLKVCHRELLHWILYLLVKGREVVYPKSRLRLKLLTTLHKLYIPVHLFGLKDKDEFTGTFSVYNFLS